MKEDEGVRYAWLMMYHEFIHYQQYLAASEEEKEVYASQAAFGRTTEAQCRKIYESELEAYGKECAVALDWGFPDLLGGSICPASLDEATFKQVIWKQKGENPQLVAAAPECLPIWAEAASHPHPEAFK
jgi:hypothetical protein